MGFVVVVNLVILVEFGKVVEELEEMGGGGGVGCCRSGGWVVKIVMEVVDWKRRWRN